jgi:hypothetical protein
MWKLIKWLFFLAIVAIVVLYVTGYKIGGKTINEYFKAVVGAKSYDEGVKDIRSLVGEAIKAVGEAVSPEVTPEERKELEDVIQKELQGSPQQAQPVPTQPGAPVKKP